MIDFTQELKKFESVIEIEDVNEDIAEADAKDVMQLLQYLFDARNKQGESGAGVGAGSVSGSGVGV